MATEPAESTRAQKVVDAQLMAVVANVPSCSTGTLCAQVPDCHVATEPSDRATLQLEAVGHDTE